jgi:hypothetical protein
MVYEVWPGAPFSMRHAAAAVDYWPAAARGRMKRSENLLEQTVDGPSGK